MIRPSVIVLLAAIAVAGCASSGPSPYPARTPAPLPAGATTLAIETEAPRPPPAAGVVDTCPSALLESVRIRLDADRLTFVLVDAGTDRPVVWPRGFSARLLDGRGELVAPDGTVIGRDGEILDQMGGSGPMPDAFHVCDVGPISYGPAS